MADGYTVVVGLEVHAQLRTRTKIFCACPTTYGAEPNTQTCPVCLGHPGVLPVLNRQAVELAVRLGLALGCTIAPRSVFARKNYFYPDVPKNYQISQYDLPTCEGGAVPVVVEGQRRSIGLERIHLEEDAGKSLHSDGGTSLVDLNRAGTPLVEIVSLPDMRGAEEAGAYLTSLRQLVRWLGISDGNMEEGSLRCDANVSIMPEGAREFGTKVEVKNMNSIRGVMAAIDHEVERQAGLLARGERIVQQTRTWDADRQVTVFMRSKEDAHDYRYFPEPDLPPLLVDEEWRQRVAGELPELPLERSARFVEQYGLPEYDAQLLCDSRGMAEYFEECAEATGDPKATSNWMMGEVLRLLNERHEPIEDFPVQPAGVAELLALVKDGTISQKIAKEVFEEMVATGKGAGAIVEEKGLQQISDTGALEAEIEALLDANPKQVEGYLGGKEGLAGFFVGQLMKATKGQANPQMANQLVREALEKRRG